MLRIEETLALARVRTLLIFRQSEIVFWVFAFPILLAVVLGFAFREAGPVSSPVPDLGIIVAWGVVSFGLALRLFRWE